MRVLQPAEWSKPRGFSHGVVVDGPGKWVVLAGQTGGDEKGDYAPDLAVQVATALKRIVKLLGEAGAGPEPVPALGRRGRRRWGRISRRQRCSISTASSTSAPKSKSKSPPSSRRPEESFET
jgi:hypothetical protein